MVLRTGRVQPGPRLPLWTDNFIKSVLMHFVIAGYIRGFRDVERVAFAYFAWTLVYTAVIPVGIQLDASREFSKIWRTASLNSVAPAGLLV